MVCCAAALLCAACINEEDMPGNKAENGNNIIINISSGTLPVSRATVEATGAEIAVSHIDVLLFKTDGSKAYHERVQMNTREKTGIITLTRGSDEFEQSASYWVYLIANSSHPADVFSNLTDLDALRQMTETTENIHMTGLENVTGAPMTFLMDGVAYEGDSEPSDPVPVVLNGNDTADKVLKVTLRRAAAKIVIKISKGDKVTFAQGTGTEVPGYYVRNMPYTTSVIAGVNATARLRIPTRNNGGYLWWTNDLITVTAYTYAHQWGTGSDFQNKVRMVVNIPLIYDEYPDDPDNEVQKRGDNWYQIPVSESKVLARNTYYEVTAEVNALGGVNPTKPVELKDLHYSVVDWAEEKVSVGGEEDKVQFLYVNKDEMEMHNMETDNTTLQFNSSSKVSVRVARAYYIDKFGQEQNVDVNTTGITATPDGDLTGSIKIYSPRPTNKTIRYIELEVTNDDNVTSRKVIIKQYPLEYITNKQSWYSYRKDFKINDANPTTYQYAGDRVYGVGLATRNISSWNGNYEYQIASSGWYGGFSRSNGFFTSKYAVENTSTGKSSFYYYYYNSSGNLSTSSCNEYNARLYHIVLTTSSGEYTIGRPRQILDNTSGLIVTDPGEDNAKLVSPSFMIASSLSGFMVGGGNLTLDDSANSLRIAREHCANYVEVAKDGTVYDDWRLPTRAELDIILNFQGTENSEADAIDFLLNGNYYYHAGGRTSNPNYNVAGAEPRCVRDAFDTK